MTIQNMIAVIFGVPTLFIMGYFATYGEFPADNLHFRWLFGWFTLSTIFSIFTQGEEK